MSSFLGHNKLYVLPQLAHTVWMKLRKKTHKIIFLVFFDFFSFTSFCVFSEGLCCFIARAHSFCKNFGGKTYNLFWVALAKGTLKLKRETSMNWLWLGRELSFVLFSMYTFARQVVCWGLFIWPVNDPTLFLRFMGAFKVTYPSIWHDKHANWAQPLNGSDQFLAISG